MEVGSRVALYQCTQEAMAFSTSGRPAQEHPVGVSCSMTSVLNRPIVDSISALSSAHGADRAGDSGLEQLLGERL